VASAAVLRGALLRGIVEAARAALDARASSIALVDPRTGDLVFEAVAGGGGPELLGASFRADQGIAGHVVQSGQLLVVDDLARGARGRPDLGRRHQRRRAVGPRRRRAAPRRGRGGA
jgi:GAF domain-containing protein